MLKISPEMRHIYIEPDKIRSKILKSMIKEFPEIRMLVYLSNVRHNSKKYYEHKAWEEKIHNSRIWRKKERELKFQRDIPLWLKLAYSSINRP